MRNHRQASVVFVLITLFIDILGMGLVIPILPRLVQSMLGGAISDASFVFGVLVAIYSVMQFVCAPILGALSDRFGRRPVILLALAGLGFDYVLLSLAPTIWWLVLGRIVAGIFGATFTPVAVPGAPFFLGSLLCLVALWLASRQFSRRCADLDAAPTSEPHVAATAAAL